MPKSEKCPHCGYCPHCGRADAKPYPWPVPYPYPYPVYPRPYGPYWSATIGGSPNQSVGGFSNQAINTTSLRLQ